MVVRQRANAYVLVNFKNGGNGDSLKEILDMESVIEAKKIYGIFNAIVRIRAESKEALDEEEKRIGYVNGVKSTICMPLVNGFKKLENGEITETAYQTE
jgi:hypothetical protein